MKVVIVGAAGFVGKYLTRELEAAGHSVVTADLPEVNLQNAPQVESLIEGAKPDAIVNLAAISSVGASWKCPADTISVNVNGTLNLLEAIRKHAPHAKTLLIGSAEEYAIPEGNKALKETDPLEASNPYGISKIAQENFAQLYRKKYGMQIVCTRSFNHTGVGQTTTFALPSFVKQVAEIDKSGKPGKILVSLSEKPEDAAAAVRKLEALGFGVVATEGTAKWLNGHGVAYAPLADRPPRVSLSGSGCSGVTRRTCDILSSSRFAGSTRMIEP